jgi:site-specific DNA-cytosine methylase
MIHSQKVQAISLFSGAGGLDIGCKKSGVEVKIAIDNDPDSVETLKLNQTSLKTKILIFLFYHELCVFYFHIGT